MEVEDLDQSDYDHDDSMTTTNDENQEIKFEPPNEETQTGAENEPETTAEPETEEEMRLCKHCNFQAEDWPAFAMHVLKPSHVKKVAETMKARVPLDPTLNYLVCDICQITVAGHIPWNAHLMGAKHRKAKEQLALENTDQQNGSFMQSNSSGGPVRNNQFGNTHNTKPYDRPNNTFQQPSKASTTVGSTKSPDEYDFTTYPQPLIGLEFISETDEPTGKIKRYYCSLCDSKFDHNLRFPHLVGQKHRLHVLKIKRSTAMKDVNTGSMKSSELSALLEKEATKYEQEAGRQQPVLKDPANNTQQNTRGGPMRNNQFGNTRNTKPYDRPNNTFQQPSKASTTDDSTQSPDVYNFTTYPQPLIGLEFISETDEPTGKIKRYYCSICDSKFDHNLRFPHLVGQKHRLNVLKIKRSTAMKDVNSGNMKSSELSAFLEKEATKYEQEAGRKQPILRNPANNTPQNTRGRGVKRGGRGVQRGTTWNTRGSTGISRGARGNSGYTSRGTLRGNRGFSDTRANTRGSTRGNTRGQSRGRAVRQYSSGRDYYNNYVNESFGANLSYNSAYNASFDNPDYYQQSHDSGQSYHGSDQSYPANRQPYSGSSGQSYSGSGQSYSGSGQSYSGGTGQSYSGSGQPYSGGSGQSYSGSGQPYSGSSGQSYSGSGQSYSGGNGQPYSGMSGQAYHGTGGQSYARPSPQTDYYDSLNRPSNESDIHKPRSKMGISSNLVAALGDLEKLVQNDDDASVALHVSNALTRALFKYRVTGQE